MHATAENPAVARPVVAPPARGRARLGSEDGFTLVETLVATVIFAMGIILTVTPVAIAMRAINRSQVTTVAENLAQAEIEGIRALDYADIGHPGGAPDGVVTPTRTKVIQGRTYTIVTAVEYVGALSGLNVIPQGGDGVQGVFDPGVNYKYVSVTVTPKDNLASPVVMETIVSPPTIGALDKVAIASVTIDRHEPYDPHTALTPFLKLTGPWVYTASKNPLLQYFPDLRIGTYTIGLAIANGWKIHPQTISSGADKVTAKAGWNAKRTIRVYQPASLAVAVTDSSTGASISGVVLTALDLTTSLSTTNSAGDMTFGDLVPDQYQVTAVRSGYTTATAKIDVPGTGGGSSATLALTMDKQTVVPVNWTFTVDYAGWSKYKTAGANVVVTHSTLGTYNGVTDKFGKVVISLPASETGFSVTASTLWGHKPATSSFNTGTGSGSLSLSLGKPVSTDRYRFKKGPPGSDGFFEYKVGSGSWVRVPANYVGRATIIVPELKGTTLQLTAFCSATNYPSSPVDTKSFTINGKNKTWKVKGSCP